MVAGPQTLSKLPEGFDTLPVEEAVEVLLRRVTDHHRVYFDQRRRQLELIRWIEQEP
jgi:hypothetical protein